MLETFLWLFVFVIFILWLSREESTMTWYIVFRTWQVNGVLQLDALGAVLCECSMDAILHAKQRYQRKSGESLRAEACLTLQHIKRAKALHRQQDLNEPAWSRTEFVEFMHQPSYEGDQDRYQCN